MTTRLYIRRPVLFGGDHIALTDDYGPRRGAPFMDGDRSLVELGMRCADGAASQGTFLFTDPYADPDADPFATSFPLAHNLVTWTEDAPGSEIWLFRGRVANDEGGRGEAVVDHETEWEITVDDCNVELRGQAFTEHWVRPEETDVARLVALGLYTLNGASSTAPNSRESCVVTVSTSHLTPNTNTVTMPAKKYVAGSQPQDVVKDCAEVAGKNYGVVIHHTGGSHLCLFYTVPGDHTTYVSPITISDHVEDWDPDHPTNPVLEPHWERGAASIFSMQQMLSGMVGVWGSSEESVFVEDTAVRDNYEYWVESYHAGGQTAAEAEDKTAGVFFQRKQLQVTHRASVILKADQVDMVGAGMTLLMRTAATHDPDVESFITRRIVECRFEPRNDGRYWCHMDIERPLLLNPRGPGYTGPIPPVQSEPPVDAITDVLWNFDTNNKDTTNTYPVGGEYHSSGYMYANVGVGPGTFSSSPQHPIGAGTFTFFGDFLNRNLEWNPNGIKVRVWYDAGAGFVVVHTSPFLSVGGGWESYSAEIVFPVGTTKWVWRVEAPVSAADNVGLEHGSTAPAFAGTAAPLPATSSTGTIGTSPIYAPADHQHGAQVAQVTDISDVGEYFVADDVEDALAELAARDHGDLGGLTDDDHPQYLQASKLGATGAVGPILIADDHSTPIVFADILLTEEGDDILYSDVGG
jgi:hypothetical protein